MTAVRDFFDIYSHNFVRVGVAVLCLAACLAVPVLLVHGARDLQVAARHSKRIAAWIDRRDTRVEILANLEFDLAAEEAEDRDASSGSRGPGGFDQGLASTADGLDDSLLAAVALLGESRRAGAIAGSNGLP